jgi:hypothetical protein
MAFDHNGSGEGSSRRKVLECMTWAATGILWTVTGGVPKSLSLLGGAEAATAAEQSFTFAQISDSHIGFHVKPVNPDALGTLKEAVAQVGALPAKPAFMIHTGDITHLSKPDQFDDAAQVIGSAGSMCTTCRASTTCSTRRLASHTSSATAKTPRARAGIPSTTMASISSLSSTW